MPPTPTPSPTLEPTATASPTPTFTPTLAPTETPTQAPTARGRVTYKVQSGDTLSSIAAKFGIAWEEIARANGVTSRTTLRVGQELVIPVGGSGGASAPAATPTPRPAQATAAPPPAAAKYVVKSGDTLSTIAAKYGITWQELAAANGLTSSSRLRIGQELIIPGKGGVSQAAATATRAAPLPTIRPATPTPLPIVLLPAPVMLSPGDQSPYSGADAFIELVWASADGIPPGAGYRVSIRWTEQGAPMEYLVPITTATSIRMPAWLFGKADQPARQYFWSVRVVRPGTDGQGNEKDVLLSPSSPTRVLYWN